MKPTPKGWPRISSAVFYDDAAAAIDWLVRVFGFEVRLRVEGEGGKIVHSELDFGPDGLLMVGQTGMKPGSIAASPKTSGVVTQSLCVIVDDVDGFCAKAREAGAKVLMAPETHDYGEEYWTDRTCELEDLEGHRWWFLQRMKSGPKHAS